ncbi:MAG: hypothetical protein II477_08595 [Lachnospiraceae bacterium]|nr:hypothetical protein [Lachnospiraceae bacterium]MBQ2101115.1 hypothetical protein [Lachnospiraceae bacterium]
MRKRRGKRVLLLVCLGLFLLLGMGAKPVELLSKTPLIDLDAAIQDAPFGQNGNEGTDGKEETDPFKPYKQAEVFTIRVRGEEVWLNDKQSHTLEGLKASILGAYKSGDRILLKDDFAEAHFYKKVLTLVVELYDERGIKYAAD